MIQILQDYEQTFLEKANRLKEEVPNFREWVKQVNQEYPNLLDLINAQAKHSAVHECIQEIGKVSG